MNGFDSLGHSDAGESLEDFLLQKICLRPDSDLDLAAIVIIRGMIPLLILRGKQMSEETQDSKAQKADAAAEKARAKALRPWFKKKRLILPIALVVIIGFSTANNGGSNSPSDTTGSETSTSQTESQASPAEEVAAEPTETVSQNNAREKAESYLSFSAFSKKGLIEQLEFEGFEKADAEYAVGAIEVDWNEQAAKKAASYLENQSFSKKSLTEQLVFEGFTKKEAEYGVSTTGL